jgi:hypothetical protein
MFEAAPVNPFSEREIAARAAFSIDDYGKADEGPYQIVMPTYPAPKFLQTYGTLKPALRECGTLCRLKGMPFRVMRWGQEGSGANGGIPCKACANTTPNPSRFARQLGECGPSCAGPSRRGPGFLKGYPDAYPIAEFRPNGQRLVFNSRGVGQVVGRPNYAVTHNPFFRTYRREVYPQQYLEAVRTAQVLANGSGKRSFLMDDTLKVPVGFVDPKRGGPTTVTPVSAQWFQELVAQGRGRSYLGQGA